jgi:conjugative relaxase-like TrwC/TraI family protein
MGWVTVIGPAQEQVEYRLKSSAGCSLHHDGEELGEGEDHQVDYRLGDGLDEELELVWIGEGLRDVGIEPGTVLQGETDKNKARALMSGVHPGTGEQLVKPKSVTDPRGKLAAGPLLAAIAAAAEARGQDVKELLGGEGWALKRFGQADRGLKREGEVHRVSYKDSVRLAKAAGVQLAGLYTPQTLELARRFQNSKTRVGLRGFDVTVDLPKSVSGLWAISPAELAKALLETHRDAVTEGFTHYEAWVSYTMRGHHGDGGAAEKVPSSGLLGWVMPHQIARPVDGAAPDPHVHTHIVIAHLAHAEDDVWRTIGGGGRDVHRMAAALDTFAKARFRALTAQRFGFQWARDERTGQWEVVGVPVELREQLSKRGAQVARELEKLGITDPKDATRMQAKVASASSREAKGAPGPGGELRTEWRRQAEETSSRDSSVTGPDGRIVVDLAVACRRSRRSPSWPPAWSGS